MCCFTATVTKWATKFVITPNVQLNAYENGALMYRDLFQDAVVKLCICAALLRYSHSAAKAGWPHTVAGGALLSPSPVGWRQTQRGWRQQEKVKAAKEDLLKCAFWKPSLLHVPPRLPGKCVSFCCGTTWCVHGARITLYYKQVPPPHLKQARAEACSEKSFSVMKGFSFVPLHGNTLQLPISIFSFFLLAEKCSLCAAQFPLLSSSSPPQSPLLIHTLSVRQLSSYYTSWII